MRREGVAQRSFISYPRRHLRRLSYKELIKNLHRLIKQVFVFLEDFTLLAQDCEVIR